MRAGEKENGETYQQQLRPYLEEIQAPSPGTVASVEVSNFAVRFCVVPHRQVAVSYTHLTLPTNREV